MGSDYTLYFVFLFCLNVTRAADYKYKGCFNSSNVFYHLPLHTITTTLPIGSDYMTYTFKSTASPFQSCMTACQNDGYPFAALQPGVGGKYLCTCVLDYFPDTPTPGCSVACPNNPTKTCGGTADADVYYTVRDKVSLCPASTGNWNGPDLCYVVDSSFVDTFAESRKHCVKVGGDLVTDYDVALVKFNLVLSLLVQLSGGKGNKNKIWVGILGHPTTKQTIYTSHQLLKKNEMKMLPWKLNDFVKTNSYTGCIIQCAGHAGFEHEIKRFDCSKVDSDLGGTMCVINATRPTTQAPTSPTTSRVTSPTTSFTGTSLTTSGTTLSPTTSSMTSSNTSAPVGTRGSGGKRDPEYLYWVIGGIVGLALLAGLCCAPIIYGGCRRKRPENDEEEKQPDWKKKLQQAKAKLTPRRGASPILKPSDWM